MNAAQPPDTKKTPVPEQPTPTPPRRVEWSWRHGPIIGPINAGLGMTGLAMIGDLAAVSPWWGAAAGGAAALAVGGRAVERRVSPLGIAYRVGCFGAAGGWMSWALATSAWSPNVLAVAAGGTLVAALAAPEMAEHEADVRADRRTAQVTAAQAEAAAAAEAARVELAVEWEDRLERVCRIPGATVIAIERWPADTGYTLQVRMPKGGASWRQIQGAANELATDANLPLGCEVQASVGVTKGETIIKVSTVDTTAVATPYPRDYSPLSLNRPIPIGMERGNQVAGIELLDDPALVVGRRGSGKTVLLQTINAGLARCTDALIWHIDLNGAGMSRPWIDPWLNGEVDQPTVDWVAPTVEEALLMVRTAIDMAKGRKGAYQVRMRSVNDDKLNIDASVPGVEIVVDEGAEAVAQNRGNVALTAALDTLTSVARAARFNEVISGLRATADIIPPMLQAQAGIKVFVRPESEHEIAQLFGWNGALASDAPYPGSLLVKSPGQQAITPARGYDLRPDQIHEIALATAARRPAMDAPTAKFGGAAYANRWDRYRTWLAANGGGTVPSTTPAGNPDENPHDPQPQQPARPPVQGGMAGLGEAFSAMQDSLEELRKVREAAERKNDGHPDPEQGAPLSPDVDKAFKEIVDAESWQSAAEPSDPNGPDRMIEMLQAVGSQGMEASKLLERMEKVGTAPSRATLYRWLNAAKKAGKVREAGEGRWATIDSPS